MSQTPGPVSNRRRSRRQAAKSGTKVRCFRNALGLGPNIAAGILDLSETGVRLLLNCSVDIGQELEIVLETVSSRQVKVQGRVVWSLATAEGRLCVGATFIKPLAYADLQLLART